MAFPVATHEITSDSAATTTHAINIPTDAVAGDTFLVIVRCTVAGAISWPDGTWTELFDASSDASDDQMAAAWHEATGTEGSTITVTTGNGKVAALAFLVKGAADPNVTPPQLSTVATGTSAGEPNATTCTPTGGAKDYLWITFFGMEGEATGITAYPASFTLNQTGLATTGTGGAVATNCRMAGAARQLNAASNDAGVWDVTGTLDDWTAYTIAFHPGPLRAATTEACEIADTPSAGLFTPPPHSYTTNAGATNDRVSVTVSGVAVDTLLVATIAHYNYESTNPIAATPAGWTYRGRRSIDGGGQYNRLELAVYERKSTAADQSGATYTWQDTEGDATGQWHAIVTGYPTTASAIAALRWSSVSSQLANGGQSHAYTNAIPNTGGPNPILAVWALVEGSAITSASVLSGPVPYVNTEPNQIRSVAGDFQGDVDGEGYDLLYLVIDDQTATAYVSVLMRISTLGEADLQEVVEIADTPTAATSGGNLEVSVSETLRLVDRGYRNSRYALPCEDLDRSVFDNPTRYDWTGWTQYVDPGAIPHPCDATDVCRVPLTPAQIEQQLNSPVDGDWTAVVLNLSLYTSGRVTFRLTRPDPDSALYNVAVSCGYYLPIDGDWTLYCGATLVATRGIFPDESNDRWLYDRLTPAEVALITDWSDLRLEFNFNNDTESVDRTFRIWWAYVELEPVGGGTEVARIADSVTAEIPGAAQDLSASVSETVRIADTGAVGAPGGLLTYANVFTSPTSLGQQTISGLPFRPKAVLFFVGNHAANDDIADDHHKGFGWAVSSSQRAGGGVEPQDNLASNTITAAISDVRCIYVPAAGGGLILQADLVSMNADGFTINWTTVYPSAGIYVSYLALGGDDIVDIAAGMGIARTSTEGIGTRDYTVGFQPDLLLTYAPMSTATVPSNSANVSVSGFIGFATSPAAADQYVHGYRVNTGASGASSNLQLTGRVVTSPNIVGSGTFREAALDAWLPDGFRLNWTITVNTTAARFFWLAIKGVRAKVGKFDVTAAVPGARQDVTDVGFRPFALMVLSANKAASAIATVNNRSTYGVATGDYQFSIWGGDRSAVNPTIAVTKQDHDRCLRLATEESGATKTDLAAATRTGFRSDGFTLTWDIADTTGQEVLYLALGSKTNDFFASPTEVVRIADSATAQLVEQGGGEASATDVIEIADTATAALQLAASATDAIEIADTPTAARTLEASVTDEIEIADTPSAALQLAASETEAIEVADTPSAARDLESSATDAIEIADTPTAAVVEAGSLTAAPTETVVIDDAVDSWAERLAPTTVKIADTVSAQIVEQGGETLTASVADALAIADTVTAALQLAASAQDTVKVADSATAARTLEATASEAAEIADSPSATRVDLADLTASVAETARLADTPNATLNPLIPHFVPGAWRSDGDDLLFRTTNLPPIASFTQMAWVRFESAAGDQTPFAFGQATTPNVHHPWRESSDGSLWLNGTNSGRVIQYGEWHHLAMVVSGTGVGQVALYLDGELLVTADGNAGIPQGSIYVACARSIQFLNGRLSALKMYGAPLTADDVRAEMRSFLPVRTADLNTFLPLWKTPFTQDLSGNGYTMTASGAAVLEEGPPYPGLLDVTLASESAPASLDSLNVSVAEAIEVSDDASAQRVEMSGLAASAAETVRVAETATAVLSPLQAASTEGVEVADAVLAARTIEASVSEGVEVADIALAIRTIDAATSDAVKIADTATANVISVNDLAASVLEIVEANDTVAPALTPLLASPSEQARLADAVTPALQLVAAAQETARLADTPTPALYLAVVVTEQVRAAETPVAALQLAVAATDAVEIADTATAARFEAGSLVVNAEEQLRLRDTPSALVSPILASAQETVAAADVAQAGYVAYGALTATAGETARIADTASSAITLQAVATEQMRVADQVVSSLNLAVAIAETVRMADTVAAARQLTAAVSEQLRLAETVTATRWLDAVVSEQVRIGDTPTGVLNPLRTVVTPEVVGLLEDLDANVETIGIVTTIEFTSVVTREHVASSAILREYSATSHVASVLDFDSEVGA